MKEKAFKDPVHDFIYVYDQVILDLIDSKEMQRLRRIKQLGVSYLTYHGAEHSRFTHSLGTYEVMRKILAKLDRKGELLLTEKEQLLAKVAALLHDIGHGPFSHSLEDVFGNKHEEWSRRIILGNTEVNKVLEGVEPSFPQEVAAVIAGEHPNQAIVHLISSQVDADRMDYLLRDSKATGVTYGQFDLERIIRVMELTKDKVLFREAGMHSIEAYILARYAMYWQVYFHPTTRSGEVILKKIFKRASQLCYQKKEVYHTPALKNILMNNLNVKDYLMLDDALIFTVLRYWQDSSDFILADLSSRILNRRLLKRTDIQLTDELYLKVYQLFKEIGLEPEYYLILDHPSHIPYDYYQPGDKDNTDPIFLKNKQSNIAELSELSAPVQAIAGKREAVYNLYYPRDFILERDNKNYTKIKNILGLE